jgi:hypothetical protein
VSGCPGVGRDRKEANVYRILKRKTRKTSIRTPVPSRITLWRHFHQNCISPNIRVPANSSPILSLLFSRLHTSDYLGEGVDQHLIFFIRAVGQDDDATLAGEDGRAQATHLG